MNHGQKYNVVIRSSFAISSFNVMFDILIIGMCMQWNVTTNFIEFW